MKWELRKLWGSPMLVVLALLLCLANGWLYYDHATAGNFAPMATLYTRSTQELEAMEEDLWERGRYDTEIYDDTLLTGDIFQESRLVRDTLERIRAVEEFPQTMAQLQAQARAKLNTGLFGTGDSFETRSLRLTDGVYETVRQVQPQVCFFGGVETLLDYRLADVFGVLLALAAALALFAQEREQGTLCLLHPTLRGRLSLYRDKGLALGAAVLFLALVLYGTCLGISAGLYGLGDLSLPVQSVYGLTACPYLLTVGGFLALFFALKLLWLLALAGLFALLANALRSSASLVAAVLLLGLSFALGTLPSHLAQSLNLLGLGDTYRLFDGLLFLNFFGLPVARLHATLGVCGVLLAGSVAGAGALFVRRSPVTAARRSPAGLSLGCHVHPMGHEGYKLLCSNGALLVLLLLVAVQVLSYRDFSGPQGPKEMYYRQYSSVLSGPPSQEKASYLAQQEEKLEQIQQQLAQLQASAQDSPWLIQEIGELAQKLEAQEPLNQAKTQYEALTSSQSYIYTTPYELLYDAGGQAANRIDLAKLLLSLSLCLPFFFSMERETGVGVLIETAGASRDVMRRKRLTAWLFALVCTAAAFLPRIVAVYQNYGLPELTAQANSLARFAALPDALPLWGVLALTMALWGLVACGGCVVVEAVSAKVRSPLPAALLCVLVLPGLTLLVFPL